MNYNIINGNNIDVLKTYPDNHFDSIVTDPPYGIDFLGKEWDANTGCLETYKECLRVLKPGGHILAFSAARTYHRLAITIEEAGFEIRDQIMWIYGSGFPKSQDVG
jgi:DNA modification methylase